MGEGAPTFNIQIFIVCFLAITHVSITSEVNGESPAFFKDKFKNSNNIFVSLTDGD